jgi:hypothetical protein
LAQTDSLQSTTVPKGGRPLPFYFPEGNFAILSSTGVQATSSLFLASSEYKKKQQVPQSAGLAAGVNFNFFLKTDPEIH